MRTLDPVLWMGCEGKAAGAKKGDGGLHETNFVFLMNSLGVKPWKHIWHTVWG